MTTIHSIYRSSLLAIVYILFILVFHFFLWFNYFHSIFNSNHCFYFCFHLYSLTISSIYPIVIDSLIPSTSLLSLHLEVDLILSTTLLFILPIRLYTFCSLYFLFPLILSLLILLLLLFLYFLFLFYPSTDSISLYFLFDHILCLLFLSILYFPL